jgi:hypothetical protein
LKNILCATHYTEIVDGSGVSPKIAELNFRTIDDPREVDELLNRNADRRWQHSDLVPGWAVVGVDPATGESWHQGAQFKPDTPIEIDGRPQKYLSASGYETQPLFLDTGDVGHWPGVLANPTTPIVITEGAKKAGCLLTLGYAAVSLPGVWNAQIKGRLKTAIKKLCCTGRRVYLAFDSDQVTKPGVRAALDRLGRLLTAEGCVLSVVTWDSSHKGIDDLAVKSGADAVKAAIEEATTFEEWRAVNVPGAGEMGEGRQPSKTQLLIQIAAQCQLFKTPDDIAYADILIDGARHTYPVRRAAFRRWLTKELYCRHQTTAGSESLQQVIDLLDAQAQDSETREVYIRTAQHEGRVYIDMVNERWEVVEVSPDGWRVVTDAPVRFARSDSMLSLPTPTTGGNLADLRELVHLSDADWVLLLSFVVFALTPSGSKPVLMLMGEAGGGKSTLCRWLQALIDPCRAPLIKGVPDGRDMAVIASRRWLLTVDNLSYLSNNQSDDLCRLATGGGFVTRKLFTDDDATCIEYRRPAVVNAIDAVATRGDLIDRALMVEFTRIPEDKRQAEETLETKFGAIHPGIFGCLLDGMATGLRILPTTKLKRCPRMADFARFAVAAETGLGFAAGTFLTAYSGAQTNANQTAVENSPLASAIERFMGDRTEWSGTPSRLLEELGRYSPTESGDRTWPRSPHHLSRQINRLATILGAVGVRIATARTNKSKLICLERIEQIGNLSSLSSLSSLSIQGEGFSGDDKNKLSSPPDQLSSPSEAGSDDKNGDGDDKVTTDFELSSPPEQLQVEGLQSREGSGDDSDDKNPLYSRGEVIDADKF